MSAPPKRSQLLMRVGALSCVAVALAVACSLLMSPTRVGTYTMETVRGMYEQPRDSVELAVFGTSTPLSGISPWVIEERLGIRSYNCSTSDQPTFASYYLLKDLLKRQSGSLKSVIIDPSIVLDNSDAATASAWAERVIVNMPLSINRLYASIDLSKSYGVPLEEALVPLLRYHSRWSNLTTGDFDPEADLSRTLFSRGQYIRYATNASKGNSDEISAANFEITPDIDSEGTELAKLWEPRSKEYLDKFVALCDKSGIDVLFVKVPRKGWDDVSHDSIQVLANSYGISFLDFSEPDVFEGCELSYASDYVDSKHPNVRGAEKITTYLTTYLSGELGLGLDADSETTREHNLSFLTDADRVDLQKYKQCREDGDLAICGDLREYIGFLSRERYTAFISTGVNAPMSELPNDVRQMLHDLGFKALSDSKVAETYAAVMSGGKVLRGKLSTIDEGGSKIVGQFSPGKVETVTPSMQKNAILQSRFSVTSGRAGTEAYSEIRCYGYDRSINLSPDGDGLNIVVFDTASGELLDTASFEVPSMNRTK